MRGSPICRGRSSGLFAEGDFKAVIRDGITSVPQFADELNLQKSADPTRSDMARDFRCMAATPREGTAPVPAIVAQWRQSLIAKYVETESGKQSDRPKLAAPPAHAKALGATVVFAKFDRLTRDLASWLSRRQRSALAAAKARGVKLDNPNGAKFSEGKCRFRSASRRGLSTNMQAE